MARVTIKTNEQALAYLGDKAEGLNIIDGMVHIEKACPRCHGTGYWSRGHWRDNGICYRCGGTGDKYTEKTALVDYAKAERRRELAAARAIAKAEAKIERQLEGQRNWCEANTKWGRVTFAEKAELEKAEREAAKAKKAHIGTVGKREQFTAKIVFVTCWDNPGGSFTQLFKFEDADGNILVWKTGAIFSGREGETLTFKATVKEHGRYQGEAQTTVTRLAVIEEKAEAEAA